MLDDTSEVALLQLSPFRVAAPPAAAAEMDWILPVGGRRLASRLRLPPGTTPAESGVVLSSL